MRGRTKSKDVDLTWTDVWTSFIISNRILYTTRATINDEWKAINSKERVRETQVITSDTITANESGFVLKLIHSRRVGSTGLKSPPDRREGIVELSKRKGPNMCGELHRVLGSHSQLRCGLDYGSQRLPLCSPVVCWEHPSSLLEYYLFCALFWAVTHTSCRSVSDPDSRCSVSSEPLLTGGVGWFPCSPTLEFFGPPPYSWMKKRRKKKECRTETRVWTPRRLHSATQCCRFGKNKKSAKYK